MQIFYSLAFLASARASLIGSRGDFDPTRYSACYADRGYTKDDATIAGDFIWQNATFATGLKMAKNDCIYKRVEDTVVSVCNGNGRDRTVNQGEIKRGIEQLEKDCGAGGTYNGVHVVNNLTFAAYGTQGGQYIKVPGGSPPPDLPGGGGRKPQGKRNPGLDILDNVRSLIAKRDPCDYIQYNGVSTYGCAWKNTMLPDGSCGGEITTALECQVFCEVRRAFFVGVEENAPGPAGQLHPPGVKPVLASGLEHTITNSFSIGIEGVLKDIFGAGVGYEYSTSITKTKSYQFETEPSDTYAGRWVVFPIYVESCGSMSAREFTPKEPGFPCGPGCIPITPPASCDGPVTTTPNVCSLTPHMVDGEPKSVWAYRLETTNPDGTGTPVPLAEQSPSYKFMCTSADPDNDGVPECNVPTARLAQMQPIY